MMGAGIGEVVTAVTPPPILCTSSQFRPHLVVGKDVLRGHGRTTASGARRRSHHESFRRAQAPPASVAEVETP